MLTVVDNASTDDSVVMLRKLDCEINVIINDKNCGFAKANNRAIEITKNEYVMLLNSDTELNDNIVDKIIEYFEDNPGVGMIGCKLLLPNGKRQVGDAGFNITLLNVFNFSFFLSRLVPKFCHGIFHNDNCSKVPIEVDWVSGAAMVVRRAVVEKLGAMTEDFFMYAEDIEWGIRLKKNGWKVSYLPSVVVMHHLGGSCYAENQTESITWIENLLMFAKSNNTQVKYMLIIVCLCLGFLFRSILYKLMTLLSQDKSVSKQFRITYSAFKYTLSRIRL